MRSATVTAGAAAAAAAATPALMSSAEDAMNEPCLQSAASSSQTEKTTVGSSLGSKHQEEPQPKTEGLGWDEAWMGSRAQSDKDGM
jgi:hypothetical protein